MCPTIRDEDTAVLSGQIAPCVGHFYLDVPRSRLHCMNDAARRFRDAGLPLLPGDLTAGRLRTPQGGALSGADLPIGVAARDGRPAEAELVLTQAGQPDRMLHCSATPLKDADGHVGAVLATVVCLPPAPDWAALAGLAHDLRTPLHSLGLTLHVLAFRTLPESERHDALQRLGAAAERAQGLAGELLEWCRTRGANVASPQLDWLTLEPVLRAALAEQAPAAGAKRLTLTATLTAVRALQALTDKGRLVRILGNLLVNAIRYTPAGGRVNLGAAWEDHDGSRALVLEVRDNGAGIPPAEQESIFHPFERGQTGRDSDALGSGVGLSVVDRLTQELGLQCEVRSEAGQGSQFRVLIPERLLRVAP